MRYEVLVVVLALVVGCTTTYTEYRAECVVQEWKLVSFVLRFRQICDAPPPEPHEVQMKDREAMNVNPFPNLFQLNNPADSTDKNLLEKAMDYPVDEDDAGYEPRYPADKKR